MKANEVQMVAEFISKHIITGAKTEIEGILEAYVKRTTEDAGYEAHKHYIDHCLDSHEEDAPLFQGTAKGLHSNCLVGIHRWPHNRENGKNSKPISLWRRLKGFILTGLRSIYHRLTPKKHRHSKIAIGINNSIIVPFPLLA